MMEVLSILAASLTCEGVTTCRDKRSAQYNTGLLMYAGPGNMVCSVRGS
jgi:hypothetical protein